MTVPTQWLRLLPYPLASQDFGYVETPHSTAVHIPGDLDLRWYGWLSREFWDSQRQPLIAKGNADTPDSKAYLFQINTDHTIRLRMSGMTSTVSSTVAVPDWGDNPIGFRVTRRKSDGRIQYFTSTDGITWVKLGADVTGGTLDILNQGDIWLNRERYDAFTALPCKVFWAEIRNGIDGTVVARPDFTENGPWVLGDDHDTNQSRLDPQGNTWTLKTAGLAIVRITNSDSIRYARMDNSEDDVSTPHHADLNPVNQTFTLRAIIRPNSWTSGQQSLLGKGTAFTAHFDFSLNNGRLRLFIDGEPAVESDLLPFSDGDWAIVAADYRASDGRVRFFAQEWDPYGKTFAPQIGTDQFTTVGLPAGNTEPLVVGRWTRGTGFGLIGKIVFASLAVGVTTQATPWFREHGPWLVGDSSATGSRDDTKARPWTLGGSTVIAEQQDYFFPQEEAGLVFGEATTEEIDLQSDATTGIIFGVSFPANPRIVGQAETGIIFGARFPVALYAEAKGGLEFSTDFEIIPPEIVPGLGSVWSVGIGGLGYMLSTLDVEAPFEFRSYEIQAIPQQRPQIDDKDEPGEQTLFPWWARAQHSWHEGSGQDVFDSPFSSRFKYCHGEGLDPWSEGQLGLLKDTVELRNDAVDDHHLLAAENALFYTHNGNLKRDPDPDAVAETDEIELTDHSGTPINSITSDGETLYAAFSGATLGIKQTPMVGALAWTDVNSLSAVELIAWVKGRLIGAKLNTVYEFDLGVTTAPEPFYTDPAPGFRFTGITESGPAIYFSGGVGDRSEIFAARLTAQDIPFASVATLGAMRSVWIAPEGETIHTIKGYLGQQVLIGTSRGVRVGTIVTGDGDLEVSGLITENRSDHPQPLNVRRFEPQGEFAWFTWSNYDATRSGLGRIHLGNLSWASDLLYPVAGEVKDVVTYNSRRYFVLDAGATSHIIKEHATDLVEKARLNLCQIRFGTTENKTLRYFDLRGFGSGSYSLWISSDDGAFNPQVTGLPIRELTETVVNVIGGRFKLQLDLFRDAVDPTEGPFLREWRLRAEPKSKGRFRYFVPLMVYDHLVTLAGNEVGSVGYAMEHLESLMAIYREGRDTLFQRLGTGTPGGPSPTLVIIEDLRFKVFAPPEGARGFGGIALAILREVR